MFTIPQFSHLARCLLIALLVLAIGCGPLTKPKGDVTPGPAPKPVIQHHDAKRCLDDYRKKMAGAFRNAADKVTDENQVKVADELGNTLKAARVESFMPIMRKMDEAEGDSEKMKSLLLKYAGELE